MRNTIAALIISFLESSTAEKIRLKEIIRLGNTGGNSGQTKKRGRKWRRRSAPPPPHPLQSPILILGELEMLGILRIQKNTVHVRRPFTLRATVSLSPRGMIFARVSGADYEARDVFIPPRYSLCALEGDEIEIRLRDRKVDRFEGQILRIVRRAREEYRMLLLDRGRDGIATGVLLDMRGNITVALSIERIRTEIRSRLKPETTIIVRICGREIRWRGGFYREVEFLRFEAEEAGDRDFERILMKYNLRPDFPPGLVPSKPAEPAADNVADWKERRDLRGLHTITIDGADSKDFDDALSLETGGKYRRLYVHIADVGHYVRRNSELDREARERATSVYPANRVIPMLPPELSENACSLIAGKNRLAFTAEMKIHAKTGVIADARFYKSIIRVDRRLTYDQAEEEIEAAKRASGPRAPEDDPSQLGEMWRLAKTRQRLRLEDRGIDLNIPEPMIKNVGSETAVIFRPRLRSARLIEEFMLCANTATAAFLRKNKAPVLYRIHEPMDEEKLEALNVFMEIYNIDHRMANPSQPEVRQALAAVAQQARSDVVERIFNIFLLRSFMQARYTGKPLGHWGLGFDDYCHFTSPIRRYPDLVVHRVLESVIKRKKHPYHADDIEELGTHCSDQERRAIGAERDMLKLNLLRRIEQGTAREFQGILTGIKPNRLYFELLDPPLEGIVEHHHLTREAELILPNDFSVYVKRLSRPVFLGERWSLELERIEEEEISLYFKPNWKELSSPLG